MKIVLDLTDEEADLLTTVLCNHQDVGPADYGWKSPKLEKLSAKVYDAVEKAGEEPKVEFISVEELFDWLNDS